MLISSGCRHKPLSRRALLSLRIVTLKIRESNQNDTSSPRFLSVPQIASRAPGFPLWPLNHTAKKITAMDSNWLQLCSLSHFVRPAPLASIMPLTPSSVASYQLSNLTPRSLEGGLSLSHTHLGQLLCSQLLHNLPPFSGEN